VENAWPHTIVQTCIIHLIRNTFRLTSRKDWDALKRDIEAIYTAPNPDAALAALDEHENKWGKKYRAMIRLWRNAWEQFIPFLSYDVEIRKLLCSTNAIESLNARYRRAIRARGHFPTEQAALKCLYLVTRSLDPPEQAAPDGRCVGNPSSTPSPSPSVTAGRPPRPTDQQRRKHRSWDRPQAKRVGCLPSWLCGFDSRRPLHPPGPGQALYRAGLQKRPGNAPAASLTRALQATNAARVVDLSSPVTRPRPNPLRTSNSAMLPDSRPLLGGDDIRALTAPLYLATTQWGL
jgi:Transposase, Mutator family